MKKKGDFKKYIQAMTCLVQQTNPERFKFCQCENVKHMRVQTRCQICNLPIRRSITYSLPKMRKPRAKETMPRKQDEAEFRRQVIKDLKGHGCIIKRIENGIGGDIGTSLPDLLIFTNDLYPPIKMVFVELKSSIGVLSYGQKRFKLLCELAGIKHIVPRPGQDVWEMVKCA